MTNYHPNSNPGTEALSIVFDEWCAELPPEEQLNAQRMVQLLAYKSRIRNLGEKSAKELIVATLVHPAVRQALRHHRTTA